MISILLFNTVLFISFLATQIFENSFERLKRKVNKDLKLTVEWVRENRLSLNINKAEIIIFKPETNRSSNISTFE